MLTPIRRRSVIAAAAVATLVIGQLEVAGDGHAAGLVNDYVTAPDGAVYPITAYDATRSGDGIYVYDPSWGSTTRQNQWGAEAVVVNDTVVELTKVGSGGNAPVPADGYTLSGYQSGASWITTHLSVGAHVNIEKDAIEQTSVTAHTVATAINPAPPYQYPGGRGTDQLIAYTDAYGATTTGTNQYGTEAVAIADGSGYRVVTVGGDDSAIPAGGLVISGHGKQQTWIQKNVIVGTLLTLDSTTREVTATTDATSYLFQAEQGISAADAALRRARSNYVEAPLDQAATTLQTAQDQLAQARQEHSAGADLNAIRTAQQATDTSIIVQQLTMESRVVESRGVWHRPQESNPAEVDQTVSAMRAAGINDLYLETFWGGRTIYPSKYTEQNTHFVGWDPLAAYAKACKDAGITLHLWMHTFYVGTDAGDGSGNGSPVAAQHPDWLVVDRAGRTRSVTEPGYYFLDPAVPAARKWLIDLFHEALDTYHVTGLQLDYTRYPSQGSGPDTTTSFNSIARQRFVQQYGVDPIDLTPTDSRYATWQQWETDQVTSFVKEVRTQLPGTILSGALETSDNAADIANFHQDFVGWVRQHLLDTAVPEVYTTSVSNVLNQSEQFRDEIGTDAFTSIGLAPAFVGGSPLTTVQEIQATRDAGATGASNFVWSSMSPEFQQALARSVYRRPAVDPQNDPIGASATLAEDMQHRVDTVYAAGLGHGSATALHVGFGRLAKDLQAGQLSHVQVELRTDRALVRHLRMPDPIRSRLTADLALIAHVLAVAASR